METPLMVRLMYGQNGIFYIGSTTYSQRHGSNPRCLILAFVWLPITFLHFIRYVYVRLIGRDVNNVNVIGNFMKQWI